VSDPVEAYFSQLRDIHASGAGVAEVSFYPALKTLLDEVGKHLKPKVTALIQLRNTGAGIPDGGLFTAGQLKGWEPGTDPLAGQLPQRGAIEVKGVADDAFATAKSEQVARYVERYGLVLVTNLRDFVLVGRAADGTGIQELESCRLSVTEAGFWAGVQQPRRFAEAAGEGLTQFLRRVLLHEAPLTDPKDVAWFLASYARTARLRLEQRHELPALASLRQQLEESLGLKFEGEKGDHFFRSTLVQTLFYGMFASWVLWARERDNTEPIPWDRRFQWETATATLHVPMVYELFRQFADPRQLGALGISEVLEWAEQIIWRIDRAAFFEKFREEHAVQYFYEPFLEAFDPELRKELGVWYTPDEVVRYMVARVDTVLREELGIADGLADPSVVVLDPCCGTGAYLVEVLRKIDQTLQAKGADALTRYEVKQAAMHRVIGFEIMPAPFVVAHLQLGILLAELGVPLKDADERAAVYLTNALTGWGDGSVAPPKDKRVGEGQLHSTLLFPEFAEERDAADRVKREEKILVVIGNPPYNGFAGVAVDEEAALIEPYKRGLVTDWGVKKNYLDDLYIRFFRLAERTIAGSPHGGVVSYISNFSWLTSPSTVVMRRTLLGDFRTILIDNLNGDSRETGKMTPQGEPDPSAFSTDKNRPGIQVGTAIATFVALPGKDDADPSKLAGVLYRNLWGASKLAELDRTAGETTSALGYAAISPDQANRFNLRPESVSPDYYSWPSVSQVSGSSWSLGMNENRSESLIAFDKESLVHRMVSYLDPGRDLASLAAEVPGLVRSWARFDPEATRSALLAAGGYREENVRPFISKPFDVRWAYVEPSAKLWNEPRRSLITMPTAAGFLFARCRAPRAFDGAAFYFASAIADQHAMFTDAYLLPPERPATSASQNPLFGRDDSAANLSSPAQDYVRSLLGSDSESEYSGVWMHVLAIGYAPSYLSENGDGVARDWPRIPLPADPTALRTSVLLGTAVARLLDPLTPDSGRASIADVGVLASREGTPLRQEDLGVTAQWAIAGKGGITMPSTGKLTERAYTDQELAAIAKSAKSEDMSTDQAVALLGDTCFDVYLNDVAYWRCVPANVWRYTIGGYQVIKKWLSYRERALLGRDLTIDESRYVTEMVRRIAALVLMQPELDINYERVKADVWEWSK
jgi:hypothetical protein